MPIEAGQQLLHYRVIEKIGEGGMGAVWRATDTTLDRDVAIKILPDAFAEDRDRLARFEREAKLLGSLNHANIATVHSIHETDGKRFLAMELVDEWFPSFSPDGRWVVYSSDESGQWEVYVVSYPDAQKKYKVSTEGGTSPRWAADGSRIFYQRKSQVMVVDVMDSGTFSTSLPKRFVDGVDAGAAIVGTWDVASDASYVVALEERPAPRLHLVLGWFEELKEQVPAR